VEKQKQKSKGSAERGTGANHDRDSRKLPEVPIFRRITQQQKQDDSSGRAKSYPDPPKVVHE